MLTKQSESTAASVRRLWGEGCNLAELCAYYGLSREAVWVALYGPKAGTQPETLAELADGRY